jgi:hypothetical protein
MSENQFSMLNLNKAPKAPLPQAPAAADLPHTTELQFQRAEPISNGTPSANNFPCMACRKSIAGAYYRAAGQAVCPDCAQRIRGSRQSLKGPELMGALVYGLGAAIAGSALYALVTIITGYQLALISIVVGVMVGKAIRYASQGRGGRPQQIMAAALTYVAISVSFSAVGIYHFVTDRKPPVANVKSNSLAGQSDTNSAAPQNGTRPTSRNLIIVLAAVAALFLGAPFFALSAGLSGLLTVFIMFIGIQRAWKITGSPGLLVTGPYAAAAT